MKAEYIDHMGSDLTVVNAARVSFDKHHTEFQDNDKGLINFLAREGHWTPFAHGQITLRESVPIFVARQRFKHTVGFVYNEVSRRYVDDDPEFYTPTKWRARPEGNKKQGSSEEVVEDQQDCFALLKMVHKDAAYVYQQLLRNGVAPEQARMVLPQSMITSYYVTGSLAAWARAYRLRSDPHAQKEIQDLASQWSSIIKPIFPVSWEALCTKE